MSIKKFELIFVLACVFATGSLCAESTVENNVSVGGTMQTNNITAFSNEKMQEKAFGSELTIMSFIHLILDYGQE